MKKSRWDDDEEQRAVFQKKKRFYRLFLRANAPKANKAIVAGSGTVA